MLFIVFSIVAAKSTSMGMLIVMRFFLDLSVASTVVNPCIVRDMFREQNRGKALSIMGIIPFIAPVLGPSIGGVISKVLGWRWTFWIIVIIAAPLQVVFFITFREKYAVRFLQLKAARIRKKTGNTRLRSKYELDQRNITTSIFMRRTISRPLRLLLSSPFVLLVGICSGVGMSLVYVIITSLPDVYQKQYKLNESVIRLTYWGIGETGDLTLTMSLISSRCWNDT